MVFIEGTGTFPILSLSFSWNKWGKVGRIGIIAVLGMGSQGVQPLSFSIFGSQSFEELS